MKYLLVALLSSLLSFYLVLSHEILIEKSLTDRARLLLEEKVENTEEFISSHPVLSQLTHFDLKEHDHEGRKLLSNLIESEEVLYSAEHAGETFDLVLKRRKLHDEQGLPHFIYHPEEEISNENNPYGRKLSESLSVEYHHVNCIYSGHLEGKPDHKAVFSFCNEEVRGILDLPEKKDQVHIQPIKVSGRRMLASWQMSSVVETDRTCGNAPAEQSSETDRVFASSSSNLVSSSSQQASESRIDVFMVNDKARTDRYTISGIFSQTLFVFTLVDTLYSGFPGVDSIAISPVGILSMAFRDAWTQDIPDEDEPSVRVDGTGGLLRNFGTFMNAVEDDLRNPIGGVVEFDVAHLLSGEDFVNSEGSQGVVGLAQVGTVCGAASVAVGTTQDLFIDSNTATVVAHEIGHNLGFEHTDEPIDDGSICAEDNIQRIMDSSGTSAQSWSTCSEFWWSETLSESPGCVLTSIGSFVPVTGAYCGNGIVDEGEECDCGATDCSIDGQISGQALDPCCNGNTCTYLAGSDCAANDLCCDIDTCSFASNTTVCRDKPDSSNCDTAEFCSGDSASCPTDVLTAFGTSCSVDGFGGNCYRGSCISSGAQCNAVGLTDSCSNSGEGNSFCQGTSSSGIRCLGSQSNCFTATSFQQISPSDGTECDPGKGCYLGTCVDYSEIPLLDVCFNFEQDEGETDVDCGGELCLPCTAGKVCFESSDCFSEVCEASEEGGNLTCIGDEIILDEDIFDVIGAYLKEHPGVAALVYLSFIGFIGYFIYHDYKERKKKKEKRKQIGSVRQQTYRNSLRHSQMSGAIRPLSVAGQRASAGFAAVEIPLNLPEENTRVVSDNPRYSGRNSVEEAVEVPEALPPVTNVSELPDFDDEIEDKI